MYTCVVRVVRKECKVRKSNRFGIATVALVSCLVILLASNWQEPLGQASASGVRGVVGADSVGRALLAPFAPSLQATVTPGTEPELFADSPDAGRELQLPGAVRHRFVTVNSNVLTTTNRLRLNLFNDVSLHAVFDSRQSLREANGPGAGDGFIWRGHIEGVLHSQITVVVAPHVIAGNVLMPSGHDYFLRYAGDGVNSIHGVYDIDPMLIPPPDSQEHMAGGSASDKSQTGVLNGVPPHTGENGIAASGGLKAGVRVGVSNTGVHESPHPPGPSLIGVLVVYTPRALDVAGSEEALLSLVNLGTDYTNTSYHNSNIQQKIYLANFRLVDYQEVDPGTDLYRLYAPNDGYMDIVHTWRDLDHADLVTLVPCEPPTQSTSCSSFSGSSLGYHYDDPDPSAWGFNLVSVQSISGYIFAHELGHNMGAGHARTDFESPCPAYLPYDYACGYGSDAGQFKTVMTYHCPTIYCKGIQNFSNPNVLYCPSSDPCYPTGISPEADNSADNALMLNISGPLISSWR